MFQFNIVFGIVIAFLSNAIIAKIGGENAWRWMLGIAAIPSLIYALMCFGIPESPRWMISRKGDRNEGLRVLKLIEPELPQAQLEAHADEMLTSRADEVSASRFWTWRLRVPICLAFLVAFFNQLSGINAILYFAPRIFEMTGLGKEVALLQSVGIGITNLIFTFVGLWLIDKLGRRTLLYIGSFGYIISLGLTAWAFFTQHYSIVPVCIFAFIAAHAVGQGAVIWVLISEIFPNRHRAEGQALGSFTHWIFAALLTTFFPKMVTAFAPGYVFLFFCFMMVLQLIWVKTMVIETKGIPLEQVGEVLWDLLPAGSEMGGAPTNFAYHAHALGALAGVVTRVGNDPLGEEIVQRFKQFGFAPEAVQMDDTAPTSTVSISLNGAGVPHYVIHVAWDRLAATPAALAMVRNADAVCFGTLAQRNGISRAAIQRLVAAASATTWRLTSICANVSIPKTSSSSRCGWQMCLN